MYKCENNKVGKEETHIMEGTYKNTENKKVCSVINISLESFCENGNKPLGSVKGREFSDWMNNCWVLKKDSAPSSLLVSVLLKCSINLKESLQDNILNYTSATVM
jgi:hypothetical protein